MTVRIHADPRFHRAVRPDADPRLAWTRCALRFAWGVVPAGPAQRERCRECWA
jgi:hypothetical protein